MSKSNNNKTLTSFFLKGKNATLVEKKQADERKRRIIEIIKLTGG